MPPSDARRSKNNSYRQAYPTSQNQTIIPHLHNKLSPINHPSPPSLIPSFILLHHTHIQACSATFQLPPPPLLRPTIFPSPPLSRLHTCTWALTKISRRRCISHAHIDTQSVASTGASCRTDSNSRPQWRTRDPAARSAVGRRELGGWIEERWRWRWRLLDDVEIEQSSFGSWWEEAFCFQGGFLRLWMRRVWSSECVGSGLFVLFERERESWCGGYVSFIV